MSTLLIVGAGGLGAPVIRILSEAGVTGMCVLDPDTVAIENLHRQILFTDSDLGRPKAEVVAERMEVETRAERLTAKNGDGWIEGRACVIDGTDNFADKYLLNDLCLKHDVPLVHAGAAQFRGQVLLVRRGGPCLRCLLQEPPDAATDECARTGIVGPAAGLVAALAAGETLRVLSGDTARSRVLMADLASGRLRRVRLDPKPDCVCSFASASILLG